MKSQIASTFVYSQVRGFGTVETHDEPYQYRTIAECTLHKLQHPSSRTFSTHPEKKQEVHCNIFPGMAEFILHLHHARPTDGWYTLQSC